MTDLKKWFPGTTRPHTLSNKGVAIKIKIYGRLTSALRP